MREFNRFVIGVSLGLFVSGLPLAAQSQPPSRPTPRAVVAVPTEVALASLITLSDGYLQKLADSFTLLARAEEVQAAAQAADWDAIRPQLAALAAQNVDALLWFALPDGSYWSVQEGQSAGNLSERHYFQDALAGTAVVGRLIVSKATGRSAAVVAAPVVVAGTVVGVFGASVYLDALSDRLASEMAIGDDLVFYSFGYTFDYATVATLLVALEQDPQLIFVDPLLLDPEMRAVFEYMITREEGTVRYRWAGRWRTALFRRSPVTAWWYVFGVVSGEQPAAAAR
jgi:hypothetical protein